MTTDSLVLDTISGGASTAAIKEMISSQLAGRTDGPADALRHILIAAELSRKYSNTYVDILLKGHELYQFGAPSHMDLFNNEIGKTIGNYVKQQGGTWEDVVRISQEVIEGSLSGYTPQNIDGFLVEQSGGNFVVPMTVLVDDGKLAVPGISLMKTTFWKINPSVDGHPVSFDEANWPDSNGNWKLNFIPETYSYPGHNNYTPIAPDPFLIRNAFDSFVAAEQSQAQKNFTSLGIDSSQFNFTQNTFAGFTFIDTSLKFDLTNTLFSGYSSSGNNGSNYDNFHNLNFQLTNPLKDAVSFFGNSQNHISPLTLDLDGDGIELSHAYGQNVYFDIDNDGFAEKVGWVDSDDGQLAMDRNGNGNIDNITELYGDDKMPAFEKLRLEDNNKDGVINALDDNFNNLRIWRDLNQNGISEDGELKTLTETGIKEISLAETLIGADSPERWNDENYLSSKAKFVFDSANGNRVGTIADVHFLNDNLNSWFKGAQSEEYGNDFQIDVEALLLPLSRGYGSLPSLHIAMSENPTLKARIKELVNLTPDQSDLILQKVEAVLFEWANVTNNDPEARATGNGNDIDARRVDFLEKFSGITWNQVEDTGIVGIAASIGVKKAWEQISTIMANKILIQGTWSEIFPNATYSFQTDEITLNDTLEGIIAKATEYFNSGSDNNDSDQDFWNSIANIAILNKTQLNHTLQEIATQINAAVGEDLFIGSKILTAADGSEIYNKKDGTDELLEISTKIGRDNNDTINGSKSGDYIFAGSGDDVVHGNQGDDFIRGEIGNDVIYGGDGYNSLEGGVGDDIIYGGINRDNLRGEDGIDRLFGEEGDDSLQGGKGADIMDGGDGIDGIDYYTSSKAVYVNLKTKIAKGGDAQGDVFTNIESLNGSKYADVLIGDDQNNDINGEEGDDVIYGGKGNDYLWGAAGKNELYGEEGNDILQGFSDAEILDGGVGIDAVTYNDPRSAKNITVDLARGIGTGGAAEGDRYFSVENVIGTDGNDVLIGDQYNNILQGIGGRDILIGGDGNDILVDGGGYDRLTGGNGKDVFVLRPFSFAEGYAVSRLDFIITDFNLDDDLINFSLLDVADLVLIKNGNHTDISFSNGAYVTILNIVPEQLNLSHFAFKASNQISTIQYSDISNQVGTFNGDELNNELRGNPFKDIINGGDGNDYIYGYGGNDVLNGGSGDDVFSGGIDADIIDGGDGSDCIGYNDSYAGVNIDFSTNTFFGGSANGDVLLNIENIVGSDLNDSLTGSIATNIFQSGAGDDILRGKGGNDILSGGSGADKFIIDILANDITNITDFNATQGDKIDLSNFDLTDITILGDFEQESGKPIVQLNLNNNQTVILSKTSYADFSIDSIIFKNGVVPTITKQIQDSRTDISSSVLIGSNNGESIVSLSPNNILFDGKGNDSLYANLDGGNAFYISSNPGDADQVYNLSNYGNYVKWIPESQFGSQILIDRNSGGIISPLTSINTNAIINLSEIADVRGLSDLNIVGGETDTVIYFADQSITVKNFPLIAQINPSIQVGNYDMPQYGMLGYGAVIQFKQNFLDESSFVFYNGILNGADGRDDLLNGGYGIDEINGGSGDDILNGKADNDTLNGGAGKDYLDGGYGNNTLSGGDGGDNFIIAQNASATDTITDFEFWRFDEKINLAAFNNRFTNFAQFKNSFLQQGSDVQIDLGDGQKIILKNINTDNLSQNNFVGNAAINSVPSATLTSSITNEDNPLIIDVLAAAADVDGDSLVISALTNPSHGSAQIIDGKITYIPNHNYNGSDSIDYTITDNNGGEVVKTLNINIIPANDAPSIVSIISSSAVDEDSTNIVVGALAIASAFSDIDGGDVLNYNASLSNGDPLPSWLSINSTTGEIISINPSNNDVGNYELIVTATDSSGASVSQSFVVTVNNVNDAPNASLITASTNEESATITLAFAGSDIDASDSLRYSILSNPAFGSVVNNNDGTFTFNLGNDFQNLALGQTKDVSFSYVAIDQDENQSNVSTATIVITGTNDAPTASITSIVTNEDDSLTIDVLAGVLDIDVGDVLSLTLVTNGLHGTASITTDANGKQQISYTPNANYNGSDVITYTISDGNGGLVSKDLTVTVNSVNDAPEILQNIQSQSAYLGGLFSYPIPNNLFSDVEGDNLTISATLADGSALPSWLVFDGHSFSGNPISVSSLPIRITATDSQGFSSSQEFNINVSPQNSAPVARNNSFVLNEDKSANISFAVILSNDSDVEDGSNIQNLTKDNIIFSNPSHGNIVINDNGIVYTPNKDFSGVDSLTYQIKDSAGVLSNAATISFNVKEINDAPVIASDSFVVDEDSSISIKLSDLLANDFDADDNLNNLTLDNFIFSNPSEGTITKDFVNNAIIYTPNQNYNGSDSLTYQIFDSKDAFSARVAINLEVIAKNDAPVARDKIANQTAKAGNSFYYKIAGGSFSDLDQDILTYRSELSDGSNLPSWLNFDSVNKSFSGTPPSGEAFSLAVKVIGSDGIAEASQSFNINITSNQISGNSQDNIINGTTTNDKIYGNAGNDNIKGGAGADILIGGIGNDQFIFKNINESTASETDLILDFVKGEDTINLSNLGFDSINSQSDGIQSAHGLEYHFDGNNTVIDDQHSNFAVKLAGEVHLDNNDFAF